MPYINTAEELEEYIAYFTQCEVLGLDTETTGLDPHTNEIRLIQISAENPDGTFKTALIDCWLFDRNYLIKLLSPLLGKQPEGKQIVKVFFNAKFDINFLRSFGIEVAPPVADIMIMYRVSRNGDCPLHVNFAHVANDLLDVGMSIGEKKKLQKSEWDGELTQEQLEYASKDSEYLIPMYYILKEELEGDNLKAIYDFIEMPALFATADMEYRGVPVDETIFETLRTSLEPQIEEHRKNINEMFLENGADLVAIGAPSKPTKAEKAAIERGECFFNPGSPVQLKKAFEAIGFPIAATDESTLKEVDHPVAYEILQLREKTKLMEFVEKLPTFLNPSTKRIHGQFNQVGTVSGRYSSSNPNMQQIPRPSKGQECVLRNFICAPQGRTLVVSDYSQVELVIAAQIAQEQTMIQAYKDGVDIHKLTASMVLNKPLAEVTKADRQLAKAVNFGLLYTMGAAKLKLYAKTSYGVTLTDDEAISYKDKFFETYPQLKDWHTQSNYEIKAGASATYTLSGRRRLFSRDPRASNAIRITSYVNTQDQGTGGDITKVALGMCHDRFRQPDMQPANAFAIQVVHDEIVVECNEEYADIIDKELVRLMVEAGEIFITDLPVKVESAIAKAWGDAK